jgi:hypothetical protein
MTFSALTERIARMGRPTEVTGRGDLSGVVAGRQLGKMAGSSPMASSMLQEPPPEDFPEELE